MHNSYEDTWRRSAHALLKDHAGEDAGMEPAATADGTSQVLQKHGSGDNDLSRELQAGAS